MKPTARNYDIESTFVARDFVACSDDEIDALNDILNPEADAAHGFFVKNFNEDGSGALLMTINEAPSISDIPQEFLMMFGRFIERAGMPFLAIYGENKEYRIDPDGMVVLFRIKDEKYFRFVSAGKIMLVPCASVQSITATLNNTVEWKTADATYVARVDSLNEASQILDGIVSDDTEMLEKGFLVEVSSDNAT